MFRWTTLAVKSEYTSLYISKLILKIPEIKSLTGVNLIVWVTLSPVVSVAPVIEQDAKVEAVKSR